MSLKGSLATLGATELVQFLGSGGRTGILRLVAGERRKELFLQDGDLVYCTAGRPKERLGHRALASGFLGEADLEEAFRLQDETGALLGELLVEGGHLAPAQLDELLDAKLADSVHDVFTWERGSFEWEDQPRLPEVPARVDLPWGDALRGGGERLDRAARSDRLLGGRDSTLRVRDWRGAFAEEVTPRRRELVHLASEGLSVGEICALRHETDFEVRSLLADLVGAGVLELRRPGEAIVSAPEPAPGLRLARRLLDQSRHLEAMDLLEDLARRHPADADIQATLRASAALVRTRVERELGDLTAVPMPTSDDGSDRSARSVRERAVLERLDRRWPLSSLVRLSPLGELTTLLVVQALFRRGALALQPVAGLPLGSVEGSARAPRATDVEPPPALPGAVLSGRAFAEPGPANPAARRIGTQLPRGRGDR